VQSVPSRRNCGPEQCSTVAAPTRVSRSKEFSETRRSKGQAWGYLQGRVAALDGDNSSEGGATALDEGGGREISSKGRATGLDGAAQPSSTGGREISEGRAAALDDEISRCGRGAQRGDLRGGARGKISGRACTWKHRGESWAWRGGGGYKIEGRGGVGIGENETLWSHLEAPWEALVVWPDIVVPHVRTACRRKRHKSVDLMLVCEMSKRPPGPA
jgi:hypothetical protein